MAKKTTPKQKTSGGAAAANKISSSSARTQPSTDPSASWALPESFTPAPSSLQPFLSTLPRDHVFLTHLDHTPTELKRRVYLVPCLLNLVITLGLLVRIYYAVPTYIQQISAIFGYDSPYKVDVRHESTTSLIGTVFDRTFLLFFDYALFSLLGSWPREFYFGSAKSRFTGPVEWRQTLGFRDTEVIVRRGRKWDQSLFVQPQGVDDDQQQQNTAVQPPPQKASAGSIRNSKKGSSKKNKNNDNNGDDDNNKKKTKGKNDRTIPWTDDEIITLKFKAGPAMTPSKISKTGYLLLDKDYDLDFRAMLDAHRLAGTELSSSTSSSPAPAPAPAPAEEPPRLAIDEIDGCVFVYYGAQWLVWRPNERVGSGGAVKQEQGQNQSSSTTTAAAAAQTEKAPTQSQAQQEQDPGDAKVERFRRALVRRKCRDVFYRWIEIVQFETNQPTTTGRTDTSGVIVDEQQRRKALAELKKLLEAKGVALDSVLDDIGGVQELPGF